jgi:hypothetical protein
MSLLNLASDVELKFVALTYPFTDNESNIPTLVIAVVVAHDGVDPENVHTAPSVVGTARGTRVPFVSAYTMFPGTYPEFSNFISLSEAKLPSISALVRGTPAAVIALGFVGVVVRPLYFRYAIYRP